MPDPARNPLTLTRQELYDLVWSKPMMQLAKEFGMSDVGLAKRCHAVQVPVPPRGYWARVAAGQTPAKDPLPTHRQLSGPPPPRSKRRRDPALALNASGLPPDPSALVDHATPTAPDTSDPAFSEHDLIAGAKPHFEAGRVSSYSLELLKPYKRRLVDLVVSRAALDHALQLANALFLALEGRGHRVVLAPPEERFHRATFTAYEAPKRADYEHYWHPNRCTVVYFGKVAIGLTLIELFEEAEAKRLGDKWVRVSDLPPKRKSRYDSDWTSKHDFATGRLLLQAYSPYPRTEWTEQWRETNDKDLQSRIPQIIKSLKAAAPGIAEQYEAGQRQAEIEHRKCEEDRARWERQHELERREKARTDSLAQLKGIIASWAERQSIEAFVQTAEQRLHELPEPDQTATRERLQIARELLGTTDPLNRLQTWKTPEER